MAAVKEQFVCRPDGERIGVLLDIKDYEMLLAEAEELEAIRAYDAAKADENEVIPFAQAIAEIERERHG